MSEEYILNNYLNDNVFKPKVGVFKTLDYDLNLNKRKAKFENYDHILYKYYN
jgi:hypothetical protein